MSASLIEVKGTVLYSLPFVGLPEHLLSWCRHNPSVRQRRGKFSETYSWDDGNGKHVLVLK